ncbi:50S ribosomal protein L1 [archaeon]|nr:MAG: 50S ribosomal protein L1 [archaeon]RLG65108.1 MAG: 50S ribosomal protein L1 [archaeon]RLG66566.1 MAG: 50S ribosomal protein L1 [archaeon]HDM24275.1 50S ribosomal protein L1 [Candidatus Bathyarchaeota archaeon]
MAKKSNRREKKISLAEAISTENIVSCLEKLDEISKPRNFNQAIELYINLRDIDLKKPENRINMTVKVRNPITDKPSICIFADGEVALNAKKLNIPCITSEELGKLAGDKRKAKKLARQYEFFYAIPQLMPVIGRSLGAILGPRGKMPTVLTPAMKLDKIAEDSMRTVRIRVRKSPMVHCKVGHEKMDKKSIAENIIDIINSVKDALPQGVRNIKSIFIKKTMGPAVQVY